MTMQAGDMADCGDKIHRVGVLDDMPVEGAVRLP
jgi:hypothetical protein